MNFSAEAKPSVYALILNWCCAHETAACVEQIEKSDYPNCKILIIDNGSTDGSGEFLQKRFPKHSFIQTGKNLGYAGANNIGIKYALEHGAQYVWIVNPDVSVGPSSLEKMIDVMIENKEAGIAGPRLCQRYKNETRYQDGAGLDKQRGYVPIHKPEADITSLTKEKTIDADYIVGCSMLLKSEMIKRIGLIREDFFMYREDVELCLRAQKNGWKTVVCTSAMDGREMGVNPNFPYWFKRNNVVLARIEKKYVFPAILHSLGIKKAKHLMREGKFSGALKEFTCSLNPVLRGLFSNIKSVVYPDGCSRA